MDIERLKQVGPKRRGSHVWVAAQRLIERHIEEGADFEQMVKGWENYARHCKQTRSDGTEFVMMARTFFGRDRHWEEWAEMDLRTPAEIAQDRRWADLQVRAERMGFTTVDRSRGFDVARNAIESEERKRASNVLQLAGLKARGVA